MVTDSNRQFKKLYKIVFLSKSRTPDKKLSLDKSSVVERLKPPTVQKAFSFLPEAKVRTVA